MEFIESSAVTSLIEGYPSKPKACLKELRKLIRDTAVSLEVPKLLETTKWGEPSYVAKKGSTIRMDWKERSPNKVYLYFICSSELVSTFRYIFGDELVFEGNRAIELDLNSRLPKKKLSKCIELALTYHSVKHLPFLGQ